MTCRSFHSRFVLWTLLLSMRLPNGSAICGVGSAEENTFVVELIVCGDTAHLASGTYVDSRSSFQGSLVYVKVAQFDHQTTKYLYRVPTMNGAQSTWYVSTQPPFLNTNSGVYDIRWHTESNAHAEVTSIVSNTAYVKCHPNPSTTTGAPVFEPVASVTISNACKCDVNHQMLSGICEQCPSGKYKITISNSGCFNCPRAMQNADINTCTCNPGSTGPTGGPCALCGVNSYKSTQGSHICQTCPASSYSPTNSTSNTNCVCEFGWTGPNAGPCVSCTAGKYKNTRGAVLCSDCAVGKFSSAVGATQNNVCQECPPNTISIAGSNNQNDCGCAPGFFGTNALACSVCPKNTYSAIANSQACTPCPPGRIAPNGGGSLDACVCVKGSDANCACGAGSTEVREPEVHVSGFQCFGADLGGGIYVNTHFVSNNSTVYYKAAPNERYLYKNGDEWWISVRLNDLTFVLKLANCAFTPATVEALLSPSADCSVARDCNGEINWNNAGSLRAVASTQCLCNTNFVRSSDGRCRECSVGSYKLVTQDGSGECQTCPSNSETLDPSRGKNGCGCNIGFSGADSGVCTKCALGTYKPTRGSTPCVRCPSQFHSLHPAFDATNAFPDCNVCQISWAWNSVALECRACSNNEFNNRAGDAECFACVSIPEYVPTTHGLLVWHKFNTDPPAWQPGFNPGHYSVGILHDSSVNQRHGTFRYSVHTPKFRDLLDRANFIEGDASFSTMNGHETVRLHHLFLGSRTTIMFYFRFSGGMARIVSMQWADQCFFRVEGIGLQLRFLFYHWGIEADFRTSLTNGFQEKTWYHIAWIIDAPMQRWTIYVNGSMISIPVGFKVAFPVTTKIYNHNLLAEGADVRFDDYRVYDRVLSRAEITTAFLQRDPNAICGITQTNGTTCPRLCSVAAGYELTASGANVQPCPVNSFQNGFALTCQSCPVGSMSTSTGGRGITACTCNTGYNRPIAGVGSCIACSPGKFKASTGQATCAFCPTAQFSLSGANECGCNTGYTRGLSTACEACGSGKYKDFTGPAPCLLCGIHRASSPGSKAMSDCACVSGYMGPTTGTCGPENTCPEHANKLQAQVRTACRCNAGYTGPDMWGPCVACDAGKYKQTSGSALCVFCFPDSFALTGSTKKTDCHCLPGFYGPSGEICSACDIGKYKDASGTAPCKWCPENAVSSRASTQIQSCKCDNGFTGPDGMLCTGCAVGKYKDSAGSHGCTSCSSFSSSPEQSTTQDDCHCDRGYSRNLDTDVPDTRATLAEQKTGVGGWRLVRFMPPRPARDSWYRMCDRLMGTITVGEAYGTADWTVPFGTHDELLFGTYNLAFWIRVPRSSIMGQSSYHDNHRNVIASSILNHAHRPVIQVTEGAAGAGRPLISMTFTNGNMDTIAYQEGVNIWGPGLEMERDRKVLTDIDSGMGVWVRNSNPTWCRICEANTYNSNIGASVCTACPSNSRVAGFGHVTHIACMCNEGYFGPPGGPCSPCPAGTYNPHSNAKLCLQCQVNTVSVPASTACQCNVGWTGPDNGPCIACPVGSSKGIPGRDLCTVCPANTAAQSASSRCTCESGMLGKGLVYAREMPPMLRVPIVHDTRLVSEKTGKDGWRLVRFLPPTSDVWYSANDNLAGTITQGTPYEYAREWSIPFGEFDEFCFSTWNFQHWLYCTKHAAIGSRYGIHSPRQVLRSSISPTSPYTAIWRFQTGTGFENQQDPTIGLRNFQTAPVNSNAGDRILYQEISAPWNPTNGNTWTRGTISTDGGMCVWVRMSAPDTPIEPVRPTPVTPATPGIVVNNADAFGPPVILYREPRLIRVTTSVFNHRHMPSASPSSQLLFAKHQQRLLTSFRGNSTTALRGHPPVITRVYFHHTLSSEFNQVSVVAQNYRWENSIFVTLAGVALPELHIPASHRCGYAVIVTAPYKPGQIITVSHLAGDITSAELLLRLELQPRDFVNCVTCPPGFVVTNATCVACQENTYNPIARGLECIACPHETRAAPASSDLRHCKCKGEQSGTSGLTGPDGGPCRQCPAQHYKTIAGSGSCDRIINTANAVSLPHEIGTPIRNILDSGFRRDWFIGDRVQVQRRGRRGHNDVVLTYVTIHTMGRFWIPFNANPLVRPEDTYLFHVQSRVLLQKNATESGFNIMP